MLRAVYQVILAGILASTSLDRAALAQTVDTAALQFLGFRAGARLDELSIHLRGLGGSPLRCKRSKIDGRVSECRAVLNNAELGGRVDLWVSAMDSLAGVMTLSGKMDSVRLESWRQVLQDRYGRVGPRVQGTQSMLQWVRRGRMIRLTWRRDAKEKVASVSLVDGRVLDGWGRSRNRTPGTSPS